jgi:hypothetical protein
MNSLFGDATSVMPTPETLAEAELLFSGNRSPVPSLDINKRGLTADNAIPGLDIDPPIGGKRPSLGSRHASSSRSVPRGEVEGVGGWISNMVARARNNDNGEGASGNYSRVDQEDE